MPTERLAIGVVGMTLAEEVGRDAELEELRATATRLQRQLAQAKARTADLIDAVYRGARDAQTIIGLPPEIAKPKTAKKSRTQVALVHATDWQCGKVTESFNRGVLDKRIGLLAEKVVTLTGLQRSEHQVDECVVFFGGDMVEGVTVFPNQAWQVDATLNDQIFHVARTMEMLVRHLAGEFKRVRIFCTAGNHGRLGRVGDFPEVDNADTVAYRICAERNSEPRIEWNLQDRWYQLAEIGGFRAMLIHGHQIRSFGGNLPAYGIVKRGNAWAANRKIPDFDALYIGHFHTFATYALADGRPVYIGNTPETDNEYAAEWIGAGGDSSQRLQFIDPAHGRVNSDHRIFLD